MNCPSGRHGIIDPRLICNKAAKIVMGSGYELVHLEVWLVALNDVSLWVLYRGTRLIQCHGTLLTPNIDIKI